MRMPGDPWSGGDKEPIISRSICLVQLEEEIGNFASGFSQRYIDADGAAVQELALLT
jgi:hypothetical protein